MNRDFVRVARSRIHGSGVFAKRAIPKGTRVIEYTGERVPVERLLIDAGDDSSAHVYSFRLSPSMVIDGSRGGNEARFINHHCDPNCETYTFGDRVYVYAMREIVRGEELTFDYQLRPVISGRRSKARDAAFRCLCGSPSCRGTMLYRRRRRRSNDTHVSPGAQL